MATISALNPYGTYSPLYNTRRYGSAAGLTGPYSPQLQQLDVLFNNLKLMSSYASSQTAAQQSAYRTQVKDFAAETKGLAASAGSLLDLSATAGTDKKIATISDFVQSFNSLNGTLQSADNLTAGGRGLLSSLQAAAAVREDDLKTIGIAYNSTSGDLTVDKVKLEQAVKTDYDKVAGILGGPSGLATSVDKTISAAAQQPVSQYLTAPAAQSTGYTQLLRGFNTSAYYSAYSQGLLLDLLV